MSFRIRLQKHIKLADSATIYPDQITFGFEVVL